MMSVRFEVRPAPGSSDADCPVLVQVSDEETNSDERRGVTLREGDAPILWMAEPFVLKTHGAQRAEWEASLNGEFAKCRGEALMEAADGKALPARQGYLSLKFEGGKVRLVLDVSGSSGAIREAEVASSGRPVWKWEQRRAVLAQKNSGR